MQARSSQHSLSWERGPLQERQLNVKLKELQYQQLKFQQEVEASKQVIQLSHEALLGRFDALEHQLLQAPKRGVRLPHTLTLHCKKVHSSYEDVEKFDLQQGIASSHNTEVRSRMYQDIVKALGEQFDEATIRRAVTCFFQNQRRHIRAAQGDRDVSNDRYKKVLRRSRQARIVSIVKKLNRRSKEVQTEEREWWNHLLISDMSEESDDEGTLVVHKPSYRSLDLETFLAELDRRADAKTRQPKLPRRIGAVKQCEPPLHLMAISCEWMRATLPQPEEENSPTTLLEQESNGTANNGSESHDQLSSSLGIGDALGPSFSNATSTPIQGRSFSETLDDDADGYDAEGVLSAISSSNRLLRQLQGN